MVSMYILNPPFLRQTPPLAGELSVYSIVCFVLAAGAAVWPFRKKKKK